MEHWTGGSATGSAVYSLLLFIFMEAIYWRQFSRRLYVIMEAPWNAWPASPDTDSCVTFRHNWGLKVSFCLLLKWYKNCFIQTFTRNHQQMASAWACLYWPLHVALLHVQGKVGGQKDFPCCSVYLLTISYKPSVFGCACLCVVTDWSRLSFP